MGPTLAQGLLLVLLVLLAVLVLGGLWLWRRRRAAPAATSTTSATQPVAPLKRTVFDAALRALYPRDADYRYERPCVLVCGPAGGGKSELLRGAGLEPVVVAGGIDSGWWRGTEGCAFELPAAAWAADGAPWTDFLRLLDRRRGLRALDAVVWVMPLAALDRDSADGDRMYRKLDDIQQRLGLALPVYVAVSGCDGCEGFGQWAARLPAALRGQSLGWANPAALGQAWRGAMGEQAVAWLGNRLRRLVSAQAAHDDLGEDGPAIFLMPDRLARSLAKLPAMLQEAMRQHAAMSPFTLRGIYLSGRAGAPQDAAAAVVDDPFAPPPPLPAPAPPLFCRDLLRERVFGEFGLATIVPRRLVAERRTRRAVLAGSGALALVWLIGLVPTFFASRQQLQAMEGPVLAVISAVVRAGDTAGGAHFDARSIADIATGLDRVEDWNTRALALPASWFSCCGGLDDGVNGALRAYYSKVLFKNIDEEFHARAEHLTPRGATALGGAGEPTGDPEKTVQFVALQEFVLATQEYEYQRAKFDELTHMYGGSWKDAAGLLHYLFNVQLNAGSPRAAERFSRLLQETAFTPRARDVADEKLRFQARLRQLHGDWLNRMFGATRLRELQAALAADVQQLGSGGADRHADMVRIRQRIGELRTLLTQTDLTWMADGNLSMSAPYQRLETDIRKSLMLRDAAAGLRAEVSGRQRQFRAAVQADSSGPNAVLAYTEGKALQVNADVAELEQALARLLQYRFTQGADTADELALLAPEGLLAWHADQLGAVRDTVAELQKYESTDLAAAPPAYQSTLRTLARLQATAFMQRELATAAAPAPCEVGWRCANFDDARQMVGPLLPALRKLELNDAAASWQQLLDRQAETLLRQLNAALAGDTLYLPAEGGVAAWDGGRGGAIGAYGARGAAELAPYFDAQQAQVAELAAAARPARTWLARPGAQAGRDVQGALADWTRIEAELARHAAKVPGGSLTRLEQFIAEDLASLDSTNCAARLGRAGAVPTDFFQRRLARVAALYRPRCAAVELAASRAAYDAIAGHYNTWMAQRYPFASAADAPPAEPEQVRKLLGMLDTALPAARLVPARRQDAQALAAQAFLDRLAAIQPLLAAILADDPAGGPAALDLWPQFRINRGREKGADQIIDWRVEAGPKLPPPTAGGTPGVTWRLGEPVTVALRWAGNSPVAPAASAALPAMRVEGKVASWQYDDPWALLRVLEAHAAPLSDLAERDARPPQVLRFVVPTRDAAGAPTGDAVAYARLAVSVHGKPERLPVPRFPTGAAPAFPGGPGAALASNREGQTP
ncbi:type VI secretion system protein [Pseudoduganella buxea]|uniref:Type VI secretion system component TssM1 N-terminal domain-containing protein n=4 Tax=Pseudoduganella buxea TaxID=1949069 RepID=A0ABQ1L1Z0_9BURK|nr:type VI secretion system protein [Pseudoduganella buxea]GGC13522.1 hypothetical protein GCM10011572_38650 [Pseudoduganella buxea]